MPPFSAEDSPIASNTPRRIWWLLGTVGLVGSICCTIGLGLWRLGWISPPPQTATPSVSFAKIDARDLSLDIGGYGAIVDAAGSWDGGASLAEIKQIWEDAATRFRAQIESRPENSPEDTLMKALYLASCDNYDGDAVKAQAQLIRAREAASSDPELEKMTLGSLIFLQGVTALRRGENENCIMCRGDSSCIIPINKSALHKHEAGSREAIQFFTEYLGYYPDDLEARWLLNVSHMTLGEHPDKVDPRYLVPLDHFQKNEVDIGQFRDIGHLIGVNRFNQAGGTVMDDFDNDGLLDLIVSSFDQRQVTGYYRNLGDGHFEESGADRGFSGQFGGLVCNQTDYNNDGLLDIFIARGAWFSRPVRPSLLRNDGGGKFTDVTEESGLAEPVNSNAAGWADIDNDGWLDLFLCCEKQRHRLYRNLGNGTFEEIAHDAGLLFDGQTFGKGCTWFDYDNDNYPDLFVNYLSGAAQLYHNNQDKTFSNVTLSQGINGPRQGFSCWAFDYDNDGWQDLFATCYERNTPNIVKGLMNEPHTGESNRLFHNEQGQGFRDVTREAGLDLVFATMGSSYADFDNDGYLDFYLATGEPSIATLIPNRMFVNRGGQKFVEVTASARVGHLQKGHAVACGDWDRDGNVDIFAQTGGATNGDRYHNIMFQNPGHDQRWITLKLIGTKTNRAALGARIKIVTTGEQPLTIHRHISPGSSFGGNPLEQTIGLAQAQQITELEIHWPTSNETQVFRDVAVDQSVEITEGNATIRVLDQKPIPVPTK